MLDIHEARERGVPSLKLFGEVDRSNVEQFQVAVDTALGGERRRLVLDLTHLVFLDSAAISVIFRTLSQLSPGYWLAVLNPTPSILRLFELIGLLETDNFRVFFSRDEMQVALDDRT